MRKYSSNVGTICLIFIILIGLSAIVHGNDSSEISIPYQTLIERLSKDGFDFEFLSKLLTDPRAESIPFMMTLSLESKETTEHYTQFLSPQSILLSKKFLRQNRRILEGVEERFHVEKEVVVAILLVESSFGENIGRFRVIPTLASMALIDSPENLQKNYQMLKEIDPEFSYEWMEGLSKKKANWAYHELKCFLKIIRHEAIDPLEVYGSYAGALGMPQFIPSSYLTYAVSKNSFEKWLLNKEEAIHSIGNYLKSHGWKKNLTIQEKKQILYHYNQSEAYVETILQVAQKIKNR